METTPVHPGASICPPFPPLRGIDIGTPERPRPALTRAAGVHGAPLFFVKEDAILVLLLDEAEDPVPHATRVAVPKLGLGEIETTSEGTNLIICDTNSAGKSATTAATAQAFKAQSLFVPEIVTHEMTHTAQLAGDINRSTPAA